MNIFRSSGLRRWGLVMVIACVLAGATPADAQLQRGDFICGDFSTYDIVWDGWRGELVLGSGRDSIRLGSTTYVIRGYTILADPQDVIEEIEGPGYLGIASPFRHRIVFWVDSNNTPSDPTDDQRFDGYLMTQTKDAIAGRAFDFGGNHLRSWFPCGMLRPWSPHASHPASINSAWSCRGSVR